ncbi:glutaredoxin [Streptomyces eurocidicus]|uniref:Glutaredoxin n=1 Tax=Streptomyces eurocidicus TaxID=66423 RepID=A0A2N8NZF1_STREU|nr:Grx4 family monothiol glutaredoxin [Streptomyces eurocidicus]MBB5120842.1 monothiol glutaredoxin [Streptomyces eurocidicus]MBF6054458.1 Grx4 family monothiol glutaredoxin [Streptomyces eurocidicus]PNE34140.1 glutaredoxin [Streptomyces eurocidicus]
MSTVETIKRQIQANPVLLYMEGTPKLPTQGSSAHMAQMLKACGERFAYVDILQHPDIRAELPGYSGWPTFPQLWVEGELIGGTDVVNEMHRSGELQPLLDEAARNHPGLPRSPVAA